MKYIPNRFPGFPKANRDYQDALEDGDEEAMGKLEDGYDGWVDDQIEQRKEER